MSLGIGNNEQVMAFQNLWRAQERMGVQPSSTARGVDAVRTQQMGDQVALRSAASLMSSLGEWASSTLGSLFGGGTPDAGAAAGGAATAAPAEASVAPAVEGPQTAQSAVLEQMKKTGDGLLGIGSSGPEVEALQEMLKAEGYDLGTAGIDGKFGPKTKAAVEAYQRDKAAEAENPEQGLKVDGIVGAQTRAALGNDRLAAASKMDETVEKLNAGGARGGPDALRADEAKKDRVDSVMDNHVDRNSVSSGKDKPSPSGGGGGGAAAGSGSKDKGGDSGGTMV